MKLYHFSFAFIVFAITVIIITDIRTNNLRAVIRNLEQINCKLDIAVDDGVAKLAEVDNSNLVILNKERAVTSFFSSLHSSFAILDDQETGAKLNLYIPVIAITMEDGYYLYYSDEFTGSDGFTYAAKRWSEKLPYYYEDEDFIYGFTLGNVVSLYDKNALLDGGEGQRVYCMDYHDVRTKEAFLSFREVRPNHLLLKDELFEMIRKDTILACIEEAMAYYTSRHNIIASQNGVSYQFSLPPMREEQWAPFLDDPSMFVVFQGYPYGEEAGETYNRIAAAGAKVSKNRMYYIEQKDWYLVYHQKGCSELLMEDIILWDNIYYDAIACIREGSYSCPFCIKNGVIAPDYFN